MAERKHVTELSFGLASQGVMLVHPSDVPGMDSIGPDEAELARNCHIYVIVKRPRLSFVPNSIASADGMSSGKLAYMRAGARVDVTFKLKGEFQGTVEYGDYPYNSITVTDGTERSAALYAHLFSFICGELSDARGDPGCRC